MLSFNQFDPTSSHFNISAKVRHDFDSQNALETTSVQLPNGDMHECVYVVPMWRDALVIFRARVSVSGGFES